MAFASSPVYPKGMDRQGAIAILREHEAELHRQGVLHAALSGDVEIVVDLDPDAHLGAYDFLGLRDYIAGLFDERVDVVKRDGVKADVKSTAPSDAGYAF
jgi:predicted nucleotidyltransferase